MHAGKGSRVWGGGRRGGLKERPNTGQ